MNLGRILRHLLTSHWKLHRLFPPATLHAVEKEIRESEKLHLGEIRFAVEAAFDLPVLLTGIAPRTRAIEVFSHLRVWDTEANNGILIYVLLADRNVEIVADRDVARRVPQSEWEGICKDMERAFGKGEFQVGALAGVRAASKILQTHYPSEGRENPNELPNRPVLL